MNKIRNVCYVIAGMLVAFGIISCSSDKNEEPYDLSASVAVTGFSIKENDNLLTNIDSVHFTIDLIGRRIYNADSLPKGTDVSKLVLNIEFPTISSAKLHITGGKIHNDTIIDYATSPNDSVDCTGNLTLTVVAMDTKYSADYKVCVNVHQMNPDSLYWNLVSRRDLPSFSSPDDQKTVSYKGKVYSLIHDDKGYMISSIANPSVGAWDRQSITLSFTPRIETFSSTSDCLYVLSNDNKLFASSDGFSWSDTGTSFYWLYGGYGNQVIGSIKVDGQYIIEQYPSCNMIAQLAPDGFPVEATSQMVEISSKWNLAPQMLLTGGIDASGNMVGAVWCFDGSSWAKLTSDKALPQVKSPTLLPYFYTIVDSKWNETKYPVLLSFGGIDAKNEAVDSVYISYDNGLNWRMAGSVLQLPEYIPAASDMQAFVIESTMTASRSGYNDSWTPYPSRRLPAWWVVDDGFASRAGSVSWQCPYIYLFGGKTPYGVLHNNVWRGVLNRLSFRPVF